MDVNQLRYFLAIARHQSITKASAELHVAQPALSMALSRMEEQLNVKLFDRQKKRLYLNSCGAILQRYSTQIVELYEAALRDLEKQKKTSEAALSIDVLDWGFPKYVLSDFIERYPDINVSINLIAQRDLSVFDKLECDVLISPLPVSYADVTVVSLRKEQLYLAVPRSHRLFEYPEIPLQELNGEHIFLAGYTSHFGNYVIDLLSKEHVAPAQTIPCIANSIPQSITSKVAVAFVVPGMLGYISDSSAMRLIPLAPVRYRASGLVYSSLRSPSRTMSLFIDFMKQTFLSDSASPDALRHSSDG